jgi:hypothetical protein
VVGDTVQVKVWHFSDAGVLAARLGELEASLSYQPAPAHELAEQRIAAALVDAQVNGFVPATPPDRPRESDINRLTSRRVRFVVRKTGLTDRRQGFPKASASSAGDSLAMTTSHPVSSSVGA